jgi:uncharacterized integral membrane protein (TIGR00697 family)
MGFITGPWSGIANVALTLAFGLILIIVAAVWADRFGKGYAPVIMVGLMAGLQMLVSVTSAKNVGLTFGGQTFFIIAGSLMYPILACGEDYINEFYGKDVAKSSVLAQLIIRVLSTLFLVWIIFLPSPPNGEVNYTMFATLMGIVPRVAASSIIATYIGGILNVNIFAKIKKQTGGKKLWLRTFVSTVVGLTTNAILFTFLAFVGLRSVDQMLQMIFISVSVRLFTGFIELGFLYFMKYLQHAGLILKNPKDLVISSKSEA